MVHSNMNSCLLIFVRLKMQPNIPRLVMLQHDGRRPREESRLTLAASTEAITVLRCVHRSRETTTFAKMT